MLPVMMAKQTRTEETRNSYFHLNKNKISEDISCKSLINTCMVDSLATTNRDNKGTAGRRKGNRDSNFIERYGTLSMGFLKNYYSQVSDWNPSVITLNGAIICHLFSRDFYPKQPIIEKARSANP